MRVKSKQMKPDFGQHLKQVDFNWKEVEMFGVLQCRCVSLVRTKEHSVTD